MEEIKDTNFTPSDFIYTPILFLNNIYELQNMFCTIRHVYFSLIYITFYLRDVK